VIDVEATLTAYPLELVVDRLNQGGIAGVAPTVAIRLLPTTNSYLDWTTNTFKTAGWGVQFQPMADLGGGLYQQLLSIVALAQPLGTLLSAEYAFSGPQGAGIDQEVLRVSSARADALLVRKYHTNRLAEASGNPGSLVLYDDDSATPIKTHQLSDESGGAVNPAFGTPARRSVGT
jgi:hypothetical protein